MTVSDAIEISALHCSANREKFNFKYLLHSRICTIPYENYPDLCFVPFANSDNIPHNASQSEYYAVDASFLFGVNTGKNRMC